MRFLGLGFRGSGVGFRAQGSGFRVLGSGFRVQGSGFWVQGVGCTLIPRDPKVLGSLLRSVPQRLGAFEQDVVRLVVCHPLLRESIY